MKVKFCTELLRSRMYKNSKKFDEINNTVVEIFGYYFNSEGISQTGIGIILCLFILLYRE